MFYNLHYWYHKNVNQSSPRWINPQIWSLSINESTNRPQGEWSDRWVPLNQMFKDSTVACLVYWLIDWVLVHGFIQSYNVGLIDWLNFEKLPCIQRSIDWLFGFLKWAFSWKIWPFLFAVARAVRASSSGRCARISHTPAGRTATASWTSGSATGASIVAIRNASRWACGAKVRPKLASKLHCMRASAAWPAP